MTMRRSGNGILIGGGALLAGVLTFGVVLGKTIGGGTASIDAVPPALAIPAQAGAATTSGMNAQPGEGTSTDLTPGWSQRSSPDAALSPEVLVLAVDRAPFQEDRLRPSTPYRLPGTEPEPAPRSEGPAPAPAPDFQLIGAVSGPNGGWAIIRVGDDGDPKMIALGESMEGYALNNVRGERAVMASADRSVNLALVGASPEVRATNNRNQGRGGNQANQGRGGGAAGAQGGRQGGAAAAIEIPAAMMEQLQSRGINPANILQQLQQGANPAQLLQRLTGAAGGRATITTDGSVQIREVVVPGGSGRGSGNGR
jgi:hypothetical protein